MLTTKKKFRLFILIIFFTAMACSDEQIKEKEFQNQPVLEFRDEGFISEETYRIIIINPKGNINSINVNPAKYAKKRALISLRKYVYSRKGTITRNTNAALLNLIDQYGKIRKESSDKNRQLYLFEIEKDNLKEYINNL